MDDSPSGVRELRPVYTVPLPVLGLAVFFATLFGTALTALPFLVEDAPSALTLGSVPAGAVVVISWWGLLRAWRTRRMLAGCRVIVEGDCVRPRRSCRFTLEDRGGRLDLTTAPQFTLAYQDELRRVGGRKVYRHGPYPLQAPVRSDIGVTASGPVVRGEFTLNADQVKIDPPDEHWDARTLVILKMRVHGRRGCLFELPYIAGSETAEGR